MDTVSMERIQQKFDRIIDNMNAFHKGDMDRLSMKSVEEYAEKLGKMVASVEADLGGGALDENEYSGLLASVKQHIQSLKDFIATGVVPSNNGKVDAHGLRRIFRKFGDNLRSIHMRLNAEVSDIVHNEDHKEGTFTRKIEDQTAKLPSTFYLSLAIGAMAVSLGLKLSKQRHSSLFMGQWVAPLLIMGIYNKIVKVDGSN